jgi:DNA-directed RNA polymerase specialized sigma24 family protein
MMKKEPCFSRLAGDGIAARRGVEEFCQDFGFRGIADQIGLRNRTSAENWLLRILLNLLKDEVLEPVDPWGQEEPECGEAGPGLERDRDRILEVLGELPSEDRQYLQSHYVEENSFEQIGRCLGIDPEDARRRTREAGRRFLGRYRNAI